MEKKHSLISWFSRSPKITVEEVIADYKIAKDQVLSPHTISDYSLTFGRLLTFLSPDRSFCEIAPKEIRAFLATIPGGRKNRKNAHIGLCALWTFAINEGIAEEHVPRKVQIAKPEQRAIIPLSKQEAGQLIKMAQESGRCRLRNRAILITLLDTGMRASELAELRLGDFEGGYFRVFGKGSKERRVPVSPSVAKVIKDYLDTRQGIGSDAPLFLSETGSPFNRNSLRLLLGRLGDRAKIPNVHPHRFRHTFAINFILNGGDAYSLQAILGHSTMEMVKRYLFLGERDLAAIHKRVSPVTNWGFV